MAAKLLTKRGAIKRKLTNFNTFISNPTNLEDLEQLSTRFEKVQLIYDEFDNIQAQIEEQPDFDFEADTERDAFYNSYFEIIGVAKRALNKINTQIQPSPTGGSAISDVSNNISVRLPPIDLPQYSGRYDQWRNFYDTFDSLINQNAQLSDIQRFHYLKSSLKGAAAQVVEGLKPSAANYPIAWDFLKERYENAQRIIRSHVKTLVELAPTIKYDYASLRNLLDLLVTNYRALEKLGEPIHNWDTLLVYLMVAKLDKISVSEWDKYLVINNLQKDTISALITFLKQRCNTLEPHDNRAPNKHNNQSKQTGFPKPLKSFVTTDNKQCPVCKGAHKIYSCVEFIKYDAPKRYELTKGLKLCLNCLGGNHFTNKCRAQRCKQCQMPHHHLLHFNRGSHSIESIENISANNQSNELISGLNETIRDPIQSGSNAPEGDNHCFYSANNQILLSTAQVQVLGNNGQYITCRALLDSGSQSNFLSEKICSKLNLKCKTINKSAASLNNSLTHITKQTTIKFTSSNSDYSNSIDCLIVPTIASRLPSCKIDISKISIPKNIILADKSFNLPGEIDMLIGGQLFYLLLSNGRLKVKNTQLVLQKTCLGWVVSGAVSPIIDNNLTVCHSITLDNQIKRFWEIEEFIEPNLRDDSENYCEVLFGKSTKRTNDGKFIVEIPFKENLIELGQTRNVALKRFYNLETKFSKSIELRDAYTEFMSEYLKLGHMREIEAPTASETYFIPHHAVIKEASTTTKLRVVFDASCKSTSGLSLNDVQYVGPKLQSDLSCTILRFRTHQFVITADVEKMYRQIYIAQNDRKYHNIIWRNSPTDPIRYYELLTVTYGTASAPYLATRCLKQISVDIENKEKRLSEIISRDFYVDDLLTGTDSIEDALQIKQGLQDVLTEYGMNLYKWASNSSQIVSGGDTEKNVHVCDKDIKTLGIVWNTERDTFSFKAPCDEGEISTKRTVLSTVSKVFDPLGLIGPVVITAKILIQRLWQLKIDWDEQLPTDLKVMWDRFRGELKLISEILVPRQITCKNPTRIEIHGFSDASEQAYGCCIYLRCTNENAEHTSKLILAKSRVAPLKTISLPRLELCGALLLARCVDMARKSLNLKIDSIHYWCDSTITIAWIQSAPARWKTFVSNRTGEIRRLTKADQWHHVRSQLNPADIISRGQNPSELKNNNLWWFGPEFLTKSESEWPQTQLKLPILIPEEKPAQITMFNIQGIDLFDRFSSLSKLKRVIAYTLRFRQNCTKSKSQRQFGPLTPAELDEAMIRLIKLAQFHEFSLEINNLMQQKPLNSKSNLLKLNPFLDEHKILRVGGRLKNSTLEFDNKYPIILSPKHTLTKLIILDEHYKGLHAGSQLLLSNIRQKYWPLSGRQTVKNVLRKCVVCFRAKPNIPHMLMGDLPKTRVTPARPFSVCGVDFAGPISTIEYRARGRKLDHKSYMCIFVCFKTKAVHLEAVTNLTVVAFLACLRRFVARRGKPHSIYSDNAKTFVSANLNLQCFLRDSNERITENLANEGIEWKFIPPRTPHFGGLWESAVKSAKHHFYRVTANSKITFEEFATLLCQIEAVLNSRPLQPLSSDPNDFNPLTPGHFLIGAPLSSAPQRVYLDQKEDRLVNFEKIQRLVQEFWVRWSKEYLSQLQVRTKWTRSSTPNFKIGQMVIVKEDNLPPQQWSLGRIMELHPGKDQLVRVVSVKTPAGLYKRPVVKVCVLPLE